MSDRRRDRDVGRFGRWAASYNDSPLQRIVFAPLQEATLAEAAREVPAPSAVLDIGCGTGLLLARAAERFPQARLAGIDAAEEMVAMARSTAPAGSSTTFEQATAEHLPFDAATFDLALTTMSFHHWADQPAALAEVHRVLVPDGVFVLTDAFPTGWLRFVFARAHHGRFNRPGDLVAMLRAAGLPFVRHVPVPRFGGTVQVVVARSGRAATGAGTTD